MPTPRKETNKLPAVILEGAAFKRQTFSRSEVAALLNVSVDTVDSEISKGRLKSFKRASRIGITGDSVDKYQRGVA